jgi:hypothetical protein
LHNLLVVLEVETHTRQVDKRLDARLAELLWVTDTRALKDEWRTERSARYDDLLACLDDTRGNVAVGQVLGWHDFDADGAIAFEDHLSNVSADYIQAEERSNHLLDLVAGQQVQILVHSACAVDVGVRRVGSATGVSVDPLEPVLSTMTGDQVLEIVGGRDALGFDGAEEVFLDGVAVVAKRHLDGTFEAVEVAVVAGTLVGLVLLHQRNEFFGGPALGLEVIVVGCGCASVHLVIDQTKRPASVN